MDATETKKSTNLNRKLQAESQKWIRKACLLSGFAALFLFLIAMDLPWYEILFTAVLVAALPFILWQASGRQNLPWIRLDLGAEDEVRAEESEAAPPLASRADTGDREDLRRECDTLQAEIESLRAGDAGHYEELSRRVESFADDLAVQAGVMTRINGEVNFSRILIEVVDLKTRANKPFDEMNDVHDSLEALRQDRDRERAAKEAAERERDAANERAEAADDRYTERNALFVQVCDTIGIDLNSPHLVEQIKERLQTLEAATDLSEQQFSRQKEVHRAEVRELQECLQYVQKSSECRQDELQTRIDYLERQNQEKQALENRLTTADDQLVELGNQLVQMKKQLDEALSAKTAAHDEYLGAVAQLEEAWRQIGQILQAISQATGIDGDLSPDTVVESLENWRVHIHVQLQDCVEREADAEARAKEAEAELERVKQALAEREAELEQLQQFQSHLQRISGETREVVDEAAAMAEEQAGLSAEADDREPTHPTARREDGTSVPPVPVPKEEWSTPLGDSTELTPAPVAEVDAKGETSTFCGPRLAPDAEGSRMVDLDEVRKQRKRGKKKPE